MRTLLVVAMMICFSAMAQTPTPTPAHVVFNWYPVPAGDHVTNYKFYEQAGTGYTLLATIPPNVTTYSMAAPTDGRSHIYVVSAVNATKESPKSNQCAWPPDPPPPGGLNVR